MKALLGGNALWENGYIHETFLIFFYVFKLRIEGLSVLGEDVEIKNELFINAVIIMPHKTISQNISEKYTIIM